MSGAGGNLSQAVQAQGSDRQERPSASVTQPDLDPALQKVLGDLEDACLSGDRDRLIALARLLRDLTISDPSTISGLERALADVENGTPLRRVLAIVLGSLPGKEGKAALIRALQLGAVDGLERSVVLASNMVVEEAPPIFHRDGHPFSVEAAPGLVVFVRGPIEDSSTREVVKNLFSSSEGAVRLAAAIVLRDSMEFSDARDAMRERLAESEPDDEVRAEAAASLAHWSKRIPGGDTERSEVLTELLQALSGSGEVVRLRLTSPLIQNPLGPDQVELLRTLASDDSDENVRRTATEILGRRLSQSPDERADTVAMLATTTSTDPSPLVRETGVMSLRHAAGVPGVSEILIGVANSDSDPEVRAAAAASLASFQSEDAAREALVDVRDNDPSEMVRAAANRALDAQ
ncbi:MAG: HEAT repeat protein [Pseudoalteromonas tetraodonis]